MFDFIHFSLFIPKKVFEKEQFDTETFNVRPLNYYKILVVNTNSIF